MRLHSAMHNVAITLLAGLCLWPGLSHAVPAPGSKITIDTDAEIVINQIVSTVTVAADKTPDCTHEMSSGTAATIGNVGDASASSPAWSPTATVLSPAVPPHVDTSQHANLVPDVSVQFFYSQPMAPSAPGNVQNTSVASVSVPQMNYPAVNLLMTTYVAGLNCSNSSAAITFNNQQAYQVAAANWTQSTPFVLITYHAGCGSAYDNGEHGFVLVESISTNPNGLVIQLNISHVDFPQAVGANNSVTVDLGTFSPTGNGTFNTTAPGNGTVPSTNSSTSGLDDSFDQNLDDSLGPAVSLSDSQQWGNLIPNVTTASPSGPTNPADSLDGFPVLIDRKRSLHKRGLFSKIGNWFKSIPKTVAKWVGNAVDAVESAALKTLNTLDKFLSINKSLSKDFAMNQYPSNTQSPWGSAYSIYNGGNIQGCGVNGKVTVTGQLTFSIASGLKEGSIGANGNLHSVIQLGLVANGLTGRIPITDQTLAQVNLGDLVLPGIVQIGPQIKLGAGAALEIGASGKLLVGAVLDWPSIRAKLDVANSGRSEAVGFAPDISPVFSADGTVSTTLDMYLKVSLGFTIGLLNIEKLTKSIELIDQPGIRATASVTGSAKLVNGKIEGQFTGYCAGVGLSANIYNKVYVNLAGFKTIGLSDWSSPSLSRCVKIGKRDLDRDITARLTPRLIDGPQYENTIRAAGKRHIVQPISLSKRGPIVKATWHKRQSNATVTSNSTSADTPRPSTINEDVSGASENATYSVIQSTDGKFDMHWSSNGNVYAIASNDTTDSIPNPNNTIGDVNSADITTDFSASSGIILGDAEGRVLHGYTNELNKYNVSRLRLHVPEALPRTSRVFTLRAVKDANGGADFLGAQDTAGNTLAPVVCVYKKLFPKVFLAKDPVLGAKMLQNTPAVTGPGVTLCGYIPFQRSGGS